MDAPSSPAAGSLAADSPAVGESSRGVIAWFVRNRVAANLLLFGILVAGFLTVSRVPQELIPETETSALSIRTVFPGASAEVVEASVLLRLEEALRDVSGVEEIRGLAAEGVGVLTIRLESWAEFQSVSEAVKERVQALATLPVDAEDPVVSEVAAERLLLRVAVHGEADERSLTEAAHQVRETLAAEPGVARVEIVSGRRYEVAIEVEEEMLTRFGLTLDQVAAALRRGSADLPGGAIRTDGGETRFRTEAEALTAGDFARIPLIAVPDRGVVTVGDVATVTDGFNDVDRIARIDGEPAVFLQVLLATEARLVETAAAVRSAIREIKLPGGLQVTPWLDAAVLFESRMDTLVKNGLQGLTLIFLLLFFTLSSRVAVWTAAGLPAAFFGGFLMMPGLGVTVNMFTLFGFIMTLGIVVDDAIVVGENIERHTSRAKGNLEAAALRGVREVFFPAAFGVLTTMAAFAPLLGLPGFWGEVMGQLPRVAIPILAFSLLDAAWILPHHMAHGGLRVRPSRRAAAMRARIRSSLQWTADTLYRPVLGWSLRNRLTTLSLGVLCLALSLGLVAGGWIPLNPTPPIDGDVVVAQISLPPGSSFDATREVVDEVEAAITEIRHRDRELHGVDPQDHLAVLAGQTLSFGPGGPVGGAAANAGGTIGQVLFEMIPAEEQAGLSPGEFADELRAAVRALPHGGEVSVMTSVLGQEADVSVRIAGDDMGELREALTAFQSRLGDYRGVVSIWDDLEDPAPALIARARPEGARIGISAAEFGRQMRQAFHGEEIQRIQRGRDEVPILLRYPAASRSEVDNLSGMLVRRSGAGRAPLPLVAEVAREDGPAVIQRVDERRAATVHASVDPTLASPAAVLTGVRNETIPAMSERFPDLAFDVVGMAGEQEETFAALNRNALFAMLLIYMLLALPLSSWTQPFVIMAAVPFGLAGAVFGHALLGMELTMTSVFGMVPLVGIVVNDALVLLDFFNKERGRGLPATEAALHAGPRRFRPIFLTTVTTCAGLAPLMLEQSVQAQVMVPMAVSLAFGVAFASLVTLLIVPVLCSLADEAVGLLRSRP